MKRSNINVKRVTLPRVSFSPESGGSVKPSRAMEEMRTQGTICGTSIDI
jgi:hypothetical protein